MAEHRKAAPKPSGGKSGASKPPIAWHPLFPAMVAVWFGALFGLGALAIRVSLLERLAVASGLDLLIPAAAPPLGINARILLALALALTGGIVGAAIGHLMARSKPSAKARRAEAAAAKAPPPAPEEIPPETAETPSGPNFIDISQLDLDADTRIEARRDPAQPSGPESERRAEPEPAIIVEAELPRPVQPARKPDPAYFPLPAAFPVPGGAAAQRLAAADLESLSHLELIERLALSLQKRREETAVYLDAPSAEALAAKVALDAEDGPPMAEPFVAKEAPRVAVPSYYPPAPEPESAAGTPERGYGSLLGVGRLPETRPASDLPQQAPTSVTPLRQDPAATEQALRDALGALQRMSGAA